ncbi:Pre-mRNA-processing protein 40A [Morella rubra]|nr:Pre-mRNA-processing protein 40A [Morella rubra]
MISIILQLIFDELLERLREKEQKEAKKRKRLEDDFFHLLSSIKELTASSKWEDCKQLFEDSREFSSIGEEGPCREIFEQYIEQLKEQAKEHERKRKEEKAKKEKEREEKEKRKVKQRREKEEGHEREKDEVKKDGLDSKYTDVTELHVSKENKRSGEDSIKKQRKRHQSSEDIVDENEKDRSRKSRGSTSDHKKSRRHTSAHESDDESRHKRHRRDHRNGSRKFGDAEELEDGEFGGDRQSL